MKSTTLDILWRLSSSDLLTFVFPNTLFGICTALCSSMWTDSATSTSHVSMTWTALALNLVKTIMWNWLNLLLFNLSNQRLPDAIAEDKLNKPYRPIPSGLLSPSAARRALLYGIPMVIFISYSFLGAYEESIIMVGLTWMYNDLRGGDENFVLRNLIIAMAFGVYNHASSRIARGTSHGIISDTIWKKVSLQRPDLNIAGQEWIVLISLVILSTMQVQDLQDVEGDKQRGRRTIMITLGMTFSRWATALPIIAWCIMVPFILGIKMIGASVAATVGLGLYTAWRVIYLKDQRSDNRSWKFWALWLVALYTLPLAVEAR